MLIEVNIKVLELGDLATLNTAQLIVGQIHKQTQQLLLLAVRSSADLALKLLDSLDILDIQSGNQIILGRIDTTAIQVTSQQHHVQQVRSAIEGQIAGTLVLLTGVQSGLDNGLGIHIVIAEVLTGLSTLQLLLGTSDVDILVDAIQLVIVPNGTNVIFLDLVGINVVTTIADQDRLSQSLVHSVTQDLPLISHDVKLGDIQYIITIDLILHINCLGIMGTAEQLNLTALLLVITFLIAQGLQLGLASVSTTGTYTAIGRLMYAIDNTGHPGVIRVQNLGLSGIDQLILGQQLVHGLFVEGIMLQLILSLIDGHCLLKAANIGLLGQLQNLVHIGMGQDILLDVVFIIKYIVLHVLISFIVSCTGIFKSLANNSINNGLLLLAQRVEHVSNGLLAIGRVGFGLLSLFSHFRILLVLFLGFYCRVNYDIFIITGIKLFDFTIIRVIAMCHNKINVGTGISACQNQAKLLNVTMENFLATAGSIALTKLVGPDGQRAYVAIINKLFCGPSRFCVIKITIGIDTFIAIFKKRMPKNRIRVIMIMVKH